jgi:serine/threonine protein phosphatase PrpC
LKEIIRDGVDELFSDPVSFLNKAFSHIHDKIRDSLVEAFTSDKYEVEVNKLTGEILKRRMPTHAFTSLKSGTTFSVIVLLGKMLYSANVGDSTGILYSGTPILKPSHLNNELNSSVVNTESCLDDYRTYIELTGDHSPENPQEYIRMRKFKCSEENPLFAELLCVYNEERPKHMCPRVFDISDEGVPTVRRDDGTFGFHYKNVRKEKATYVTDKYGENALSVVRALGDYALSYRGVSCEPEIRSVNLEPLFNQMKENMELTATAEPALTTVATLCVVLCTDGVWDNWLYDHVGKFVFDKSCVDAIAADTARGAERVTNSFMIRNQTFAKKNFGWNSDNATGIVMYISDV